VPGKDSRYTAARLPHEPPGTALAVPGSSASWLRAIEEGVVYRDQVEIGRVEERGGALLLTGARGSDGASCEIAAGFLVDASGGQGLAARLLAGHAAEERPPISTSLVYGHFEQVADFAAVAREEGCDLPPGPYPDDRAAVHHLTDLGWMYVLPFDHGVVSAGFMLDLAVPAARELAASGAADPAGLWRRLLGRYPSLGRQFARARPVRPIAWLPRVRHRLSRAAGPRWLALPSTFAVTDPLFSTGIAWSLRGIERVGRMFEAAALPGPADLAAYETLLAEEADHVDLLVRGAYRTLPDFELAGDYSMLYFAAASFAEAARRLAPERGDGPWEGFLGCRDEVVRGALREAVARIEALPAGGPEREAARPAFRDWLAAAIAPRNIAGLACPRRDNLYPVDLEALVEGAAKLGLTREEIQAALPRLRG
jgi:tetracycline 7-halogenase / FADH2 O2-dependent halogenase